MLSEATFRRCGLTVALLILLAGRASADFKSLVARVPKRRERNHSD